MQQEPMSSEEGVWKWQLKELWNSVEVAEVPRLRLESQPGLATATSVPWPKGPAQVCSPGLYVHPRNTWRDLIHTAAHGVCGFLTLMSKWWRQRAALVENQPAWTGAFWLPQLPAPHVLTCCK
ncbi:hypothetical protein AV530_007303 [Patagioenas fasciata monilis]|uniref:Uncharacterized protein n=2 Tax=Patagioenas fasciata monilis TaxID=372326 RepID=A0A1V4JXC7_PATFA|nr:hypothetical protein AV530_007303 [Patagioenas fasciata monilis]